MKIKTLLLALALGAVLAPSVQAQGTIGQYEYAQGVGRSLGAVSTDIGIVVKYIGTSPVGGNITVAANGDISLFTGAVGSGTVDTTTECPVALGLGGVIDVSDAACNTLGEVVDAINSSPNWRAYIVDGLRSDSSDDRLITAANQSASVAKGVALLKDTTVALNVSLALVDNADDINTYLNPSTVAPTINQNPFGDTQGILLQANGTFTGTGADFFDIISVKTEFGSCPTATASTPASIICGSKETVSTLYTVPGGGTTVNKTYDFSEIGFRAKKGEKLLVRLRAASTFTAAQFSAGGFLVPAKNF